MVKSFFYQHLAYTYQRMIIFIYFTVFVKTQQIETWYLKNVPILVKIRKLDIWLKKKNNFSKYQVFNYIENKHQNIYSTMTFYSKIIGLNPTLLLLFTCQLTWNFSYRIFEPHQIKKQKRNIINFYL